MTFNFKSFFTSIITAILLTSGYLTYQWKQWVDREIAVLRSTIDELQKRVPSSKDEYEALKLRAARGELAAQFIERQVNTAPPKGKK